MDECMKKLVLENDKFVFFQGDGLTGWILPRFVLSFDSYFTPARS
jgi:hypothetical protein